MSIITEALKKAEKEKDKKITSKEYIDKIFGPERKGTYEKEKFEEEKTQLQQVRQGKTLIVSGSLLVLAIIFLTVANLFLFPSADVETVIPPKPFDYAGEPLEAEAYTDMSREIVLIEDKSGFNGIAKVFKRKSTRQQLLSNFTLNGIVYDTDDSWAIINNRMVRTGDALDGAKIISIEPQKVVLNFEGEKFDLVVK